MSRILAAVLLLVIELVVFAVAPRMVLLRWRQSIQRALETPPGVEPDADDQAEQAM